MRFRRFDLVRFGHFTGATLDLPPGNPDFHLLLGANEAGKTTVMRAVEDLLFGFPVRTPYDFLHPYAELRLGAVVEEEGEQLEFLRRKGSKDTVLDAEGAPFPRGERRLATYLGGADRDFFGRMFNLGHERLARGGREILQSHGEVGKTLFSAGSGLLELRKEARRLDEEAETLWGPRKKRTRRYTQARDRFDTTKRSLLDTIRRPQEWKELHRRVETSEAEVARLRGEAAERSREQRVASRIPPRPPIGSAARRTGGLSRRSRRCRAAARGRGGVPPAGAGQPARGNAQVSVLEEQLATKREGGRRPRARRRGHGAERGNRAPSGNAESGQRDARRPPDPSGRMEDRRRGAPAAGGGTRVARCGSGRARRARPFARRCRSGAPPPREAGKPRGGASGPAGKPRHRPPSAAGAGGGPSPGAEPTWTPSGSPRSLRLTRRRRTSTRGSGTSRRSWAMPRIGRTSCCRDFIRRRPRSGSWPTFPFPPGRRSGRPANGCATSGTGATNWSAASPSSVENSPGRGPSGIARFGRRMRRPGKR